VDELFLFLFRALGVNGDGKTGTVCSTDELVDQMREDPDYLGDRRSLYEHYWRTTGRTSAHQLVQILVSSARYLSDLSGGDIPLLAPRDEVELAAGLAKSSDTDAMQLGRVVQRCIRSQVSAQVSNNNAELLAELRSLLGQKTERCAMPSNSQYLTTQDIALRLDLSVKTVQRLCAKFEIDADKTSGGQWRTTETRLRRSPYLKSRKRSGGSDGQLE
jgi:hypothetical protein